MTLQDLSKYMSRRSDGEQIIIGIVVFIFLVLILCITYTMLFSTSDEDEFTTEVLATHQENLAQALDFIEDNLLRIKDLEEIVAAQSEQLKSLVPKLDEVPVEVSVPEEVGEGEGEVVTVGKEDAGPTGVDGIIIVIILAVVLLFFFKMLDL